MNSTNEQNNRQTERNSKDAKKDDSTGGEFICLIQPTLISLPII